MSFFMRSYSKPLRNPQILIVNQTLIQEILEVVEQAAIASAKLTGLGQKDEADAAAVEAMRLRMGKIEMKGKIVIGAVSYTHLTLPTILLV